MAVRMQSWRGRVRLIRETWAEGRRVQKHLPKREWASVGVFDGMAPEEIKAALKRHNSSEQLKRWDEVKQRISAKQARDKLAFESQAPQDEVATFLNSIRLENIEMTARAEQQLMAHWRAVARMLLELGRSPWDLRPVEAAHYYLKKTWSPSHAKKVHSLFNRWGVWWAARRGQSFVSAPLSRKALKAIGAAYEKSKRTDKASIPLTREMLEKAKNHLTPQQHRWLYVSIAFGLRPEEVDKLSTPPGDWWKLTEDSGVQCLDVRQGKLSHLSEDKQWKLIPILHDDQRRALEYIHAGGLERPRVALMRLHIHPKVTPYGGRKAFEYEMCEVRGYAVETVAAWMGHQDLKMLWQRYRNRRKVRLK
jgi:integrase